MTRITVKQTNRVVVCAANRGRGGLIVLGIRHHDAIMNDTISRFDLRGNEWEQGFVDQKGAFLTRTEAWPIALAAGQITRRVGGDTADGGTLYSENLY